jgi:hypothetical protein
MYKKIKESNGITWRYKVVKKLFENEEKLRRKLGSADLEG